MGTSKARPGAFDTAAYYLSFRDRTGKELRDKLMERGYSDGEIDAALSKLTEYGYVDDENYALSYIKSNMGKKGVRRISYELSRKGIDEAVLQEQLYGVDIDEESCIGDILARRYRDVDFEDERQLRRLYSFFVRRGFRYESINRAVADYRKCIKNIS